MRSEETVRNRRDELQAEFEKQIRHGILRVDRNLITELDILDWVLGEETEKKE